MYEEIILCDESTKTDSTNTDSNGKDIQEEIKESSKEDSKVVVDIDYKQIEIAYYNALKQIELEKANREALEKATQQEQSDVVQFASSTDARLYTSQFVDAPASSAQQQVAYLLDTRNILLIFLLSYFVINAYTKLKNTLSKYYGGNE